MKFPCGFVVPGLPSYYLGLQLSLNLTTFLTSDPQSTCFGWGPGRGMGKPFAMTSPKQMTALDDMLVCTIWSACRPRSLGRERHTIKLWVCSVYTYNSANTWKISDLKYSSKQNAPLLAT